MFAYRVFLAIISIYRLYLYLSIIIIYLKRFYQFFWWITIRNEQYMRYNNIYLPNSYILANKHLID